MRLTFLGTGTSGGVPSIGCHCPVCSSSDPHDRRLRQALGDSRYVSMDAKVHKAGRSDLRPRLYYDHINYSYRLDGNNVDIDTENVELAANQLKYQGVIAGIKSEFDNLQAVMKST